MLVRVLARAFRHQRLLDKGRYASISEMAAAERVERGYLGSLLRLMLLAPEIVEAILNGRPPESLDLPRLLEPFPMDWSAQPGALAAGVPPAAALTDCPQWEPDLRSNLYLTSDEAKFVTGAELVIEGGYTAQ